MFRLFVHASPDPTLAGRTVEVPPQGLVLSRVPGEGLFINDAAVAHGHCRFDPMPYGLVLTDGGTGQGTWANGAPVGQVTLRPGDQVQAGSTLFVVMEDVPDPAPGPAPTARRGFPWAPCCLSCLGLLLLLGAAGAFVLHRYGLPWVKEQLNLAGPEETGTEAEPDVPPPAPPTEIVPPVETNGGVSLRLEPGDGHRELALGGRVTVYVPPGALDAPATLAIRPLVEAPPLPAGAMEQGEAYDISTSGRNRFAKPLALALSYDPSRLPPGGDAALSVAAAYYDEDAKVWVTVPAAVDAARNRLVLLTDHLCPWTTLYKKLGWETHASRHFNIVYKPTDAIVYLDLKKGGLLYADAFVKDLGEWLDRAWEAYKGAGFDVPGFETVPVERYEARVVPSWALPGFEGIPGLSVETVRREVPVWAFLGSATTYWGAKVVESQWDVYSGNLLFADNFKNPDAARHDASHELFHAVQNRYFSVASMAVRRWWMEATADYAAARLGMGIKGKAPLMGADIKPRYLEKCLTFHIPDDKGNDPQSFHDYSTAHFVDYLVGRGADFKAMWDAVADPSIVDLLQVLDPLDKHLKGTFGDQRGLAAFYGDFARYFVFDPAGPMPLKPGETLREKAAARADTLKPGGTVSRAFALEPSFTAQLWSVKPQYDAARPARSVKVTAPRRDAGVALYLYRLPDGKRRAGGGGFEGELGDKPLTLGIGQDDHLLVLAVRGFEGGKAGAEVRIEDLAEPPKVKEPPPAAPKAGLEIQMVLYASYDRGYQDDQQRWPASGFQTFENTGWRAFVLSGSGHFTGTRLDGDKESRVEGIRTASAVTKLKWINHRLTKRPNGDKVQEEWWDIELEDIPVTPSDPNEYILEGYDLSTGQWNTGFEKHVPKLEHKVTFYPSGTTIQIANIFWQKTMVKSIQDMEGFAIMGERPFIRLYFSGP